MRIFGMRMHLEEVPIITYWLLLHWLRVTFYVRVMSYNLLHELRITSYYLSNFVADIIFVYIFAALLKNDNQEVILILDLKLFCLFLIERMTYFKIIRESQINF